MVFSGLQSELTLRQVELGIRMTLAQETGQHEYFTIEAVMEMTGENEQEALNRMHTL